MKVLPVFLIEGLQTVQPFCYRVTAKDGVICLYQTDQPLTPEAEAKMQELGWFDNSNGGWYAFA